MKIGRLEIWWHKHPFSKKEMEEMGIIDVPEELCRAYKIINGFKEKHHYLLSDWDLIQKEIHDKIVSQILDYNNKETRKQKDKETKDIRRLKMEQEREKARLFKDYQRRSTLGLLTLEELEERRLRKEKKHLEYIGGNKRK